MKKRKKTGYMKKKKQKKKKTETEKPKTNENYFKNLLDGPQNRMGAATNQPDDLI